MQWEKEEDPAAAVKRKKYDVQDYDEPYKRGEGRGADDLALENPYSYRKPAAEPSLPPPAHPKQPKKNKKIDLSRLTRGHLELTSRMISEILKGQLECLVCVDKIYMKAVIWSCSNCYKLYHIGCIKKWKNSSQQQASGSWHCPHCRHVFTSPPVASCYCGKSPDAPPVDPFVLPHSCGDPCGKLRKGTNCPHPCPLLCHPGPCPECPALAPSKNCYCGKTVYQKRCGQPDNGESCGAQCNKTLNCGRHQCNSICHPSDCSKCDQKMTQKCYCGRTEEVRVCGSEEVIDMAHKEERHFSCGEVCDRVLECGHHRCQDKCHPSLEERRPACQACPLSVELIKTCPCGKSSIPKNARKSCLDPIPTCKELCNKPLPCGRHKCKSKCHNGPCNQVCQEVVKIPCRCGLSINKTLSMECHKVGDYQQILNSNLCNRLCSTLKECGTHRCSQKCCPVIPHKMDPEGYHVCRIPCPKKLNCGVHSCPLTCHRGKCPSPCLEITSNVDIVCPCGKTTQYAPIICGSPLPVCPSLCSIERTCGHPQTPHSCHWKGDCPSCVTLVTKRCAGGHTNIKAVPCYKTDVFCGRVCGKPMHCKDHTCSRLCHDGPCEVPFDERTRVSQLEEASEGDAEEARETCGQKCKKELKNCLHLCKEVCHPGRACPTEPCKQKSKISCSCGRLTQDVPCIGRNTTALPCDDVCKKEIRNKQLAIAFGILPTTKPPQYSDILLNMAKVSPQFILNLEARLNQFIRNSDSKLKLPVMDTVQRRTVVELAKYYGLDFEIMGVDPQKYIVLTKKAGTSRLPTALLSQMASFQDDSAFKSIISNTPSLSSNQVFNTQQTSSLMIKPVLKPSATLQVYDLSPVVKNSHLMEFLKPYADQYSIQWVDDCNALILFNQEHLMRRALSDLSSGQFKVKAYSDANPETAGEVVLGGTASKAAIPVPLKKMKKKTDWSDGDNEWRTEAGGRGRPAPVETAHEEDARDGRIGNAFDVLGKMEEKDNWEDHLTD
uniref:R3H domain-containing protein n=1 Tax=Arcella intermedia TaxID=1963864 RepID=A0A6B2KX83_9EUKA